MVPTSSVNELARLDAMVLTLAPLALPGVPGQLSRAVLASHAYVRPKAPVSLDKEVATHHFLSL